ncbi:MAG TPA: ABC transporter permease subunit, partial [Acidimicrobiales bacterium]|nr:ABC transporter permease subunit [Acidimicrobiales bacterium]
RRTSMATALDTRAPTPPPSPSSAPAGWRRVRSKLALPLLAGGGGALIVGYLSLIVLIPVAALVAHGFSLSVTTHGAGAEFWRWSVSIGWKTFWTAVTAPGAKEAIFLSLWLSLSVAAINAVMGVAIAWVLVRDKFIGKGLLEASIDLPFALPTIVAGVVLLAIYGVDSPIHVDLFETWMGLMLALLFVTLPFSVRAVQPVLASLDLESEAAARTLGAGGVRTFFTVVLPSLWPAILGGFGLAFARAVGVFGSISLIAGGLGRTTTASYYIYNLTQGFLWTDAAAVSTALLVISLVILVTSNVLSRRFQKRTL